MTGTFTLPSGRKARTQSNRRYVVWRDDNDYPPYIVRRSDNRDTAISVARNVMYAVVIDTSTGEALYGYGVAR